MKLVQGGGREILKESLNASKRVSVHFSQSNHGKWVDWATLHAAVSVRRVQVQKLSRESAGSAIRPVQAGIGMPGAGVRVGLLVLW